MSLGQEQRFLRPDGFPTERVGIDETDPRVLLPDHFSALRFLIAIEDGDTGTIHEVLRERPALPLLSGMASLARAFGRELAGDKFRNELDLMALNEDLDPLGVAESYRPGSRRA
jgi:hypothetical protein